MKRKNTEKILRFLPDYETAFSRFYRLACQPEKSQKILDIWNRSYADDGNHEKHLLHQQHTADDGNPRKGRVNQKLHMEWVPEIDYRGCSLMLLAPEIKETTEKGWKENAYISVADRPDGNAF